MSPDQGWDLITIILGGAITIVLVVVLGVPIVRAIQNILHKRQMRRHFSDTRGRRRKLSSTEVFTPHAHDAAHLGESFGPSAWPPVHTASHEPETVPAAPGESDHREREKARHR
jgi:hypothetical protein